MAFRSSQTSDNVVLIPAIVIGCWALYARPHVDVRIVAACASALVLWCQLRDGARSTRNEAQTFPGDGSGRVNVLIGWCFGLIVLGLSAYAVLVY